MRRAAVYALVVAALVRERRDIEQYISKSLEISEAVPLVFSEPTVAIEEVRSVRVAPRFRGDYPAVEVAVELRVRITAATRRGDQHLGLRTTAADVQLTALGTVDGLGYHLQPQRARLTAWWGYSNQPLSAEGRPRT
ncbi:MAG TPA: hypothetical protein VKW09_14305 [bacterium]|nr:hypothetical protein [bacterium]